MKEETPEYQQQTISSLVKLFYRNLMEYTPKHYSTALHLCIALAKRYNEKKEVDKLENLLADSGIGYPLGLLETICFRDLSQGKKVSITYNYGYDTESISLMKIIVVLEEVKKEVIDIFTRICVKYEVDVSIISIPLEKEQKGFPQL